MAQISWSRKAITYFVIYYTALGIVNSLITGGLGYFIGFSIVGILILTFVLNLAFFSIHSTQKLLLCVLSGISFLSLFSALKSSQEVVFTSQRIIPIIYCLIVLFLWKALDRGLINPLVMTRTRRGNSWMIISRKKIPSHFNILECEGKLPDDFFRSLRHRRCWSGFASEYDILQVRLRNITDALSPKNYTPGIKNWWWKFSEDYLIYVADQNDHFCLQSDYVYSGNHEFSYVKKVMLGTYAVEIKIHTLVMHPYAQTDTLHEISLDDPVQNLLYRLPEFSPEWHPGLAVLTANHLWEPMLEKGFLLKDVEVGTFQGNKFKITVS